MSNRLNVPNTDSYITWVRSSGDGVTDGVLNLTLRAKDGKPIAKAKLTSERLHAFICKNNTMK